MADVKTLNTHTLNHWLQSGKAVSILDIRSVQERQEWFSPHSLHFNAYDHLKAKAEDPFKGLQTPENYLSIIEKNLKGDFSGISPIDLEAGANRCAVS